MLGFLGGSPDLSRTSHESHELGPALRIERKRIVYGEHGGCRSARSHYSGSDPMKGLNLLAIRPTV